MTNEYDPAVDDLCVLYTYLAKNTRFIDLFTGFKEDVVSLYPEGVVPCNDRVNEGLDKVFESVISAEKELLLVLDESEARKSVLRLKDVNHVRSVLGNKKHKKR